MALVVPVALLLLMPWPMVQMDLEAHMTPIGTMVLITPMVRMASLALMNDLYGSLRAPMLWGPDGSHGATVSNGAHGFNGPLQFPP